MNGTFCVFILTHGRPDNIKTLKALEQGGYTGKTYLVIDNEDDTEDEYRRLYGDMVVQFDKLEMSKKFDTYDTFDDRRTIVYARNACFDIAKELGYDYFLELDDDYTAFMFRFIDGKKLGYTMCKSLDRLFPLMIDFLEQTGALTVAFAQGGDFIGGSESANFRKGLLRKAMNTFFCKTENRFDFVGRINEDVNTYTLYGSRGKLLFTLTGVSINQLTTQKNKGGMTDVYLSSGTYVKSFYSIIGNPSCVYIKTMGDKHKRIHHAIRWNNCTPKIISEKYKKKGNENANQT